MPERPQSCGPHERSLRETSTEVDALRELMEERDRRYEERFKAMDDKTGLALASSEKAVTKAEAATEKRFDAVNEFRGSLKDQADRMMPRLEADGKMSQLSEKIEELKKDINSLRESRSEGAGAKNQSLWAVGIVVAVVVGLFGAFAAVAAVIVAELIKGRT